MDARSWVLCVAVVAAGCLDGPGAGPPDREEAVRLVDDLFEPGNVTIEPGGEVRWRNDGQADHTVTVLDPAGVVVFDVEDPGLAPGNFVKASFAQVGEYRVWCRYHSEEGAQGERSGMTMRLTVAAGPD